MTVDVPARAAAAPDPEPEPEQASDPSDRRPWTRRWIVAFLGFFLIGASWTFAAPYDGTPDEMQHIFRASGVWHGQIAPKLAADGQYTGTIQTVSDGLDRTNCWAFQPRTAADCAEAPGGDSGKHDVLSRAGRYNPVYYAAVGLPLRLSPDWTGVYAARLISAAMASALLACAAYAAAYWTRHRLVLGGVLLAATPMVMHLAGAVNPNGLEIAAGVALFAALTPMLLDREVALRRDALILAIVAGAIMAVLRSLGPLWLLCTLGVLLVPTRRPVLAALRRSRAAVWGAVVLAVAILAGAAWTVLMKVNEAGASGGVKGVSVPQAVEHEFVNRWGDYVIQMIGHMSWLDARPPMQAYFWYLLVLGAVVLLAAVFGTWSDRWRMFAIAAVAFGVPTVSDAVGVADYGFIAQGRYTLPVMVGLPIVAAVAISRQGLLDAARSSKLTRGIAVAVVPLHLVFLWFTMIRWQAGQYTSARNVKMNALVGNWHPPVGSIVPLLLALLGTGLILRFCWTVTRTAPVAVPATASRPTAVPAS